MLNVFIIVDGMPQLIGSFGNGRDAMLAMLRHPAKLFLRTMGLYAAVYRKNRYGHLTKIGCTGSTKLTRDGRIAERIRKGSPFHTH